MVPYDTCCCGGGGGGSVRPLLLAVRWLLPAVLLTVGRLRAPPAGLGWLGRRLLLRLLLGCPAAPRLGQDGVRVLVHALLAVVLRPGGAVVRLACLGVHVWKYKQEHQSSANSNLTMSTDVCINMFWDIMTLWIPKSDWSFPDYYVITFSTMLLLYQNNSE